MQKKQFPNEAEKSKESLWPLRLTNRPDKRLEIKESLIAPGLTIEGKVEGVGHVRVAVHFKGEVSVKGDLTVEQGAHISGEVRAENIVVRGEVEGNIQATSQVELLESGVLIGDLEASSLIVDAGSRMRGMVEFCWDERGAAKLIPLEGEAST